MIASVAATVPFSSAGGAHQLPGQVGSPAANSGLEHRRFSWRRPAPAAADAAGAADPSQSAAAQRLRAATSMCLSVVIATLCMSIAGLTAGTIAYDAIDSQDRGSFWAHISVFLGCASIITGVKLNTPKWVSVGLLFNILSMVLTFCGAVIDGLSAGKLQGIVFRSCDYTSSAGSVCNVTSTFYGIGGDQASMCSLPVAGGSCYCCQIYQQACNGINSIGRSSTPFYFSGVPSCNYVSDVYMPVLWLSSAMCALTFVLLTASVAACAHYAACLSKVQPLHARSTASSGGGGGRWPPIYETALPVLPPSYDETHFSAAPSTTEGIVCLAEAPTFAAPVEAGPPKEWYERPPPYAP